MVEALAQTVVDAGIFTRFTGILEPYMPVFYVSFVATLILTPMMRMLAVRHGIVDDPDGKRKVHTQPIAYLGGVSIFLGWLAGVSISVFLKPHNADQIFSTNVQIPPGVLLGAAVVVLFGLMDDVYSLSPKIKLFGQMLAGMFLILPGFFGIGTDFFLGGHLSRGADGSISFVASERGLGWLFAKVLENFGFVTLPDPGSHTFVIFSMAIIAVTALIATFIVIATCNATNLLDGLDGLCSGVTGVMSVGYLGLAIFLALKAVGTEGGSPVDPTRITLSLALLGAVMGFLPFNFNPASIFMGDTGSMFLGYICGTMMLLFAQYGAVRWVLAAVIIFGLPMLDTFLAIVRRKLNGKPIFSPDSNHFHHFLIKRGFTVRQAVLLSYGIAAVFVSFALMIVIFPTRLALGIYFVLFGWIIVAAFKMGIIFQHKPVVANTTINATILGHSPTVEKPVLSTTTMAPVNGAAHPETPAASTGPAPTHT